MKEEKTIIEEIRGSMVHELTESGQQHSDTELYEKQSRTVSPSADQDLESTQLNPSIEPSTGVQTTDEEMLFEEEGAVQTQPRSLGSRKRDSGVLQPNDDSAQTEYDLGTPKRIRMSSASTPTSVMKVFHIKRGKAIRQFTVRQSPYKRIAKTLRYKQTLYTARACLRLPKVKLEAVKHVTTVVDRECQQLCKKKPASVLRVKSIDQLKSFSWDAVITELKKRAPTLLSILIAAAQSTRHPRRQSEPRRKKSNPVHRPWRQSVVCMAAAVLLKERNQQMCKPQSIVSTLLYAGHASKKVFKRLNSIGVSTSHQSALNTVSKLGIKHDSAVMSWKESCAMEPDYIIVGDNVDKNVSPRDMRQDNQVKSMHYFHSFAVHDRVCLPDGLVGDELHAADVSKLTASSVLPTIADCVEMRNIYIILAARIIVENLSHFGFLEECVVHHIPHKFSADTTTKSEIVPLGVIPKDENKNEGMVEILETLQKYVPIDSQANKVHTVALGGDQLTVERCRSVQNARVNSDNEVDALHGLFPFTSDWHAEAVLLQVIFDRLYCGGSNLDGGSLYQLRNLINRRSVAKDVKGRFNATIDFFELAVNCHVVAAAMHFFGLKRVNDAPTLNTLPVNMSKWHKHHQWREFSKLVGKFIDRYIIVDDFAELHPRPQLPRPIASSLINVFSNNPHAFRISTEHTYTTFVPPTRKRHLPAWLQTSSTAAFPSQQVMQTSPDGVFNYARAVLNDGLFLMAFRDAIHEGDGVRILNCWKFMLTYFFSSGHKKYALEAFYLLAYVHAAASPRLAHQMTWSRTANTCGGQGRNIPIDLLMEHLNRQLKDSILGLGANLTEKTIVNSSKSLKGVMDVCSNFDQICLLKPESIHHTKKGTKGDRDMILQELVSKSDVFQYTPGRQHNSTVFKSLVPNVAQSIDAKKLFSWIEKRKNRLKKELKLKAVLGEQ